jgi:hypothetical protein
MHIVCNPGKYSITISFVNIYSGERNNIIIIMLNIELNSRSIGKASL